MTDETTRFWQMADTAEHIAIILPKDRGGDALCAGLALLSGLSALGKKVDLFADQSDAGIIFEFLPEYQKIKTDFEFRPEYTLSINLNGANAQKVKYSLTDGRLNFTIGLDEGRLDASDIRLEPSGYDYDLVIALGAPELSSLGRLTERHAAFFYRVPLINIDSSYANDNFGQLNIVELKAAAVSEIVYNLLISRSESLTEDAATCLLAGLISRTRNFRNANVTPVALEIASDLVRRGGDRELIINRLYRQRSVTLLKLWGFILARLTASADKHLLWSTISLENFAASQAGIDDLMALFDEVLISLPETAAILLMIGTETGSQGILYSAKNLDAMYVARQFSPQGTARLARFEIDAPLKEAGPLTAVAIEEDLKKLLDN